MHATWGPVIFPDLFTSEMVMHKLTSLNTRGQVLGCLRRAHAMWGSAIFTSVYLTNLFVVDGGAGIIRELVHLGYDLNSRRDSDGQTPLIEAVNRLRCDIVMVLVDLGVDLEVRDNDGLTAMNHVQNNADRLSETNMARFNTLSMLLLDRNDMKARNRTRSFLAAGGSFGFNLIEVV